MHDYYCAKRLTLHWILSYGVFIKVYLKLYFWQKCLLFTN